MARNSMTVRQQVKNLLASVRLKEELLRKRNNTSSLDDSEYLENAETSEFIVLEDDSSRNKGNNVESIKIAINHKDFESLPSDRLQEASSCIALPSTENEVTKKPFLKKGEGLARFRMKPRKLKRKTRMNSSENNYRSSVLKDVKTKPLHEARSAPLIAFEQLEQKLDDSSFCSTSSMIVKLMEDSIKSTPIKSIKVVEPLQDVNLIESNLRYSDPGMLLGVIDEETNADDDAEEMLRVLLQARLLELQAEIDMFKTENSQLSRLRANYETEYNQFCEERIVLLEKIRVEHLSSVNELEEEKEKLKHEKRAFEKYMKEAKSRTSKEEKEEIRLLKEEIKVMKEEMNRKESRWAAAQARNRTEIKLLKDHNAALQEEVNDLKKTKKKVMFAPVLKKSKSFSSVNVAPEFAESRTTLLSNHHLNSAWDLPPTSDSDVFTENFRSSNKSCNSILPNMNNFSETNDLFDNVSTCELFSSKVSELTNSDGIREREYTDGRKEIWCTNGSVKKISPDGKTTKTIFYNGDVEETNVDENVVKYYHAASGTWHSKFSDGLEIKEFPDGQIERYYEDGSAEIVSSNGTIFTVNSRGEKKWRLKNGSIVTINEEKREKQIEFPNGQLEVHVPEFKRREYPDGTVKTIYSNSGMQETRYPNGRIRLKTHDGTLISDTEVSDCSTYSDLKRFYTFGVT